MLTENEAALKILMNEDLYLSAADLFWEKTPDVEYLAEEPVTIIEKQAAPEFTFIGKNLKKFLVLTDKPMQENHLKALENTLLRKQMSLDDVAVLDFSTYSNVNFDQLNASFMAQKIVCFGLKPTALGLPEAVLNQVIDYADCQFLYTFSFEEMLGNKEKTKAFWEPMKAL